MSEEIYSSEYASVVACDCGNDIHVNLFFPGRYFCLTCGRVARVEDGIGRLMPLGKPGAVKLFMDEDLSVRAETFCKNRLAQCDATAGLKEALQALASLEATAIASPNPRQSIKEDIVRQIDTWGEVRSALTYQMLNARGMTLTKADSILKNAIFLPEKE